MLKLLHFDEQQPHTLGHSSGNAWKGIVLEQVTVASGAHATFSLRQHTMVLIEGVNARVHFELSGHLVSGQTQVNQVAAFLPAASFATVRCLEDSKLVLVGIDSELVASILGARNFKPTPRFSFDDPLLVGIVARLQELACEGIFAERVYAESLGTAAVLHLGKIFQSANESYVLKGRLCAGQLKQVIDFAHESLQADIGLHELASLVHLSPYHFGRLFKQTSGLSPYQFILQLKIERAKKMILRNHGPIGDIAHQLNFADQSHFSNAFRKATGVSPREFLQQQATG